MVTKLQEIDAILIRYADTESAEAISARIDGLLNPRQVMARIDQLLEVPDRLTALQQDQLVTLKMRQLIARMEDLPFTTRTAEVLGAQLERLGNRLDKRQESTEKELTSLYAFQGTIFLDALVTALDHMKASITANSQKDREAQWDASLESAIRLAQIELDKHEIDAKPTDEIAELVATVE